MPTVTEYRNPHYSDSNKSRVDLEINTKEFGWIPTTIILDDNDQELHIIQIKEWLNNNINIIEPYVAPSDIVGEEALLLLRGERNQKLLNEVDPIVTNTLRWGNLTQEQQTEIANYRQELLDITINYPNPVYVYNEFTDSWDLNNVNFPAKPDSIKD